MSPTLRVEDRIFASPLVYGAKIPLLSVRLPGIKKPERGHIVVVQSPSYTRPAFPLSLFEPIIRFFSLQRSGIVRDLAGKQNPKYLVKRIIGLPGDTIQMSNFYASVMPQDSTVFYREQELISHSYTLLSSSQAKGWKEDFPLTGNLEVITLNDNEFFLLGDNRPASYDSRTWGPLSGDRIFGKVLVKYWPVNKSGKL